MAEEEKENKKKKYYWAVCNDCGCNYDYVMPFCPKCTAMTRKSSGYKVKVSDELPTQRIIRWNKPWLTPYGTDNSLCINCETPERKFCSHFGDPDYRCEFFTTCECNKCCGYYSKLNRQMVKQEPVKNV